MSKIVIDPITRIEGHLKIEVTIENGEVKNAQSSGMLFRGLETILRGRDPRDASQYTQRICGVCPTVHGMASTFALDNAFGITDKIPENARILRNLILGACNIADHILHFYHLAALDYMDVTKVTRYTGNGPTLNSVKQFIERGHLSPFVPRYEGDYRLSEKENIDLLAHYIKALDMRRKGQEMLAIFGGKMPHNVGVVPGGVTEIPTLDKIVAFLWRLNELREFIDAIYIPDVLTIAKAYGDYFEIGSGCGNLLSYGLFDLDGKETDPTKRQRFFKQGIVSADLKPGTLDINKIKEEVKHSWYSDGEAKHPSRGETKPEPRKKGAYSWVKAPRYDDKVYEVGPLARIMINYAKGDTGTKTLVDSFLPQLKATPKAMFSVLGRHLARALCAKLTADIMPSWLLQLKPDEPTYTTYSLPDEAFGMGLVDGARGALGHWIEIKNKKIANYQCVVPSTWNFSPRDDREQPGAVEQALIGTKIKDENNPFEIVRIVRSFDPCLACAVHLIKFER